MNVVEVKAGYILAVGGILVAGGVYIYFHWNDLPLFRASSSPASTMQQAEISWAPVDRSREGFTLQMPANTREIEVPAYTEEGGAEQVNMIYAFPDPSISFSISWADHPPVMRAAAENAEQTLEDARNGALARAQSVLVSEARSSRQGFPVRDFVGRNQNGGTFNARLVLAGRRLYLLMASFPGASARREDDVNRFFDSFRVVNAEPVQ